MLLSEPRWQREGSAVSPVQTWSCDSLWKKKSVSFSMCSHLRISTQHTCNGLQAVLLLRLVPDIVRYAPDVPECALRSLNSQVRQVFRSERSVLFISVVVLEVGSESRHHRACECRMIFEEWKSMMKPDDNRYLLCIALASSGSIVPMGAAPADDDDANLWRKSS